MSSNRILAGLLFFLSILTFACKHASSPTPAVVNDGVNIAYNKCGTGDTTLLFIHGWGINKEYWEPQTAHFCPRYTVVTIDLPGFGASGKNRPNWDFSKYTSDVKAIIDQLNLKNVVMISHSMSGDILLTADNEYPSSLIGIVGIDNLHEPHHTLSNEQRAENDSFFHMLGTSFDSTYTNVMKRFLFHPATDPRIVDRVSNDITNSDSIISTSILRTFESGTEGHIPRMQQLSHKLYLLNSDMYPVAGDSLSKYCAKGFHVELVPGTGHYPMIEKPEEFNAALERILASIAKGE